MGAAPARWIAPKTVNSYEGGVAMLHQFKQHIIGRRFGARAIMGVALSSLFAGLLMASSVQWTPMSVAQGFDQKATRAVGTSAVPNSFADLAERLGPTVVNIQVTKVAPVGDVQEMPDLDGPSGEFFQRFFRDRMPRREQRRMQGSGSGVIISQDGYILTNNHVVDGAQEVTVTTSDKQEYKARVIGRDDKTDLAVLKVAATGALPMAPMGHSADLKVGEWVVAIGNPFGLGHTVTAGIVSAKGRVIGAGPYDDFIQTDAPINPGNSGGPLFDMDGEVVGINTAIFSQSGGNIGIGFAVPANLVKNLVPELETKGTVTRGWLGVSVQPVTPDLAH